MSDDDLAFAGIRELRRRLDARELSAPELATHFLDRLERFGGGYRAVRTLLPGRAAAEAARSAGSGALAGIPYGLKDAFPARGGPTSFGMRALRDLVIDEDAAPVRALDRAGAVLVAKLSCTELITFREEERPEHALDGATRNPWDPGRWTGGSSSGSAAAVAAGLVPFAIGSDSGGSISTPSAYTGITGLRPSWRAVPDEGGSRSTPTLCKTGPMARSAEDCAIVFEELVRDRPAEDQPWTTLRPAPELTTDALRGLRIAFHEGDVEGAAAPGIRSALRDGMAALRDLGPGLHDLTISSDLPIRHALRTIALAECAWELAYWQRIGLMDFETDPEERAGFHAARSIPAADYLEALEQQGAVKADFARIFAGVDVIVSYTTPVPAPRLDQPFEPIPAVGGNSALLYGGILAELPSLTVPVGLSDEGLPVALQLVGPKGADRLVLALGEALQRTTNWHLARPPGTATTR